MPSIKRQTAYKCRVSDILEGEYVQKEGWEPNYVKTSIGELSRINVIAVIVSKENNSSMLVDDGSGKIRVRNFNQNIELERADIGDVVLLIGRPRKYNEELYLLPEIVRIITDQRWLELRKLELKNQKRIPVKKEEVKVTEEVIDENPVNNTQIIINKIKELDKGEGAETEQVIKETKLSEAERHMQDLINEGEIFEVKAGRVKVLE
jgi:RPA family protein